MCFTLFIVRYFQKRGNDVEIIQLETQFKQIRNLIIITSFYIYYIYYYYLYNNIIYIRIKERRRRETCLLDIRRRIHHKPLFSFHEREKPISFFPTQTPLSSFCCCLTEQPNDSTKRVLKNTTQ
jgi:hypothetical protein